MDIAGQVWTLKELSLSRSRTALWTGLDKSRPIFHRQGAKRVGVFSVESGMTAVAW